jgi:hypothetical protein
MPTLSSLTAKITRDWTIGGVPIGDAVPVGATHKSGAQDPLASLRAPKAFDSVTDLIGWLRDQSIRDVLQSIGIGSAKAHAESALDGKFLDVISPKGGANKGPKIIEINGINTSVDVQKSNAQFLADKTGRDVHAIHNATGGLMEDAVQFLNDKYVRCNNPAVNTVRDIVLDAVKKGERIDLVCHSQGAIITERALCEAQAELKQELKPAMYERFLGADWQKITKKSFPAPSEARKIFLAEQALAGQVESMLSNVRVESFGGAARMWPDGPKYVHHVNMNDPVPGMFGMSFVMPPTHPGKGAIVHRFSELHPTDKHGADAVDASVHGPEQVYFKHALSYEDAVAQTQRGASGWQQYA